MRFHRVTRDKNHLAIAAELRQRGFSVGDLSAQGQGFPDIIVSRENLTVLMEIKMPDAGIYVSQIEFLSTWKGYAGFVRTIDEALEMMRKPSVFCLDADEKDKMAQIAVRCRAKSKDKSKNPQIKVTEFDKLMKEGCDG